LLKASADRIEQLESIEPLVQEIWLALSTEGVGMRNHPHRLRQLLPGQAKQAIRSVLEARIKNRRGGNDDSHRDTNVNAADQCGSNSG
jgi:hypothetical protein